jgi:hypothetical protein
LAIWAAITHRVQLTSDGHGVYLDAVEGAFGNKIDYGQLVKTYGAPPDAEKRYSPAKCTGAKRRPKIGNPEWKQISTSYIERHVVDQAQVPYCGFYRAGSKAMMLIRILQLLEIMSGALNTWRIA